MSEFAAAKLLGCQKHASQTGFPRRVTHRGLCSHILCPLPREKVSLGQAAKRPEMAPEGDGWNGTRVSHAAQFESASKRAQHSTQMGVLLTETLCVESDGVGGYGSHGKHKDVEV